MIKIRKMNYQDEYGIISTSYKWVRAEDIVTFEETVRYNTNCLEIVVSYKDESQDVIYTDSYTGDSLSELIEKEEALLGYE